MIFGFLARVFLPKIAMSQLTLMTRDSILYSCLERGGLARWPENRHLMSCSGLHGCGAAPWLRVRAQVVGRRWCDDGWCDDGPWVAGLDAAADEANLRGGRLSQAGQQRLPAEAKFLSVRLAPGRQILFSKYLPSRRASSTSTLQVAVEFPPRQLWPSGAFGERKSAEAQIGERESARRIGPLSGPLES